MIGDKPVYKAGHGLFTTGMRRGSEKELSAMEKQARNVIRGAVTKGKTVAVLCSGDPTIFCPHTGFMKEFKDLDPQMIPGISSFNAASAAWGEVLQAVVKATPSFSPREWARGRDTKAPTPWKTVGKPVHHGVFHDAEQSSRSDSETENQLYRRHAYRYRLPCRLCDTETIVMATLDTILERLDSENPPFEHLVYVGDFLK